MEKRMVNRPSEGREYEDKVAEIVKENLNE